MKKILKHDYFKNIDTEHKAYFLGFLVADGNISKTTNRILFTIGSVDKYILETLKEDINSENTVRCYDIFDQRTQKINYSTSFQFSSKYIKQDLKDHGIDEFKTNTFKTPLNIPENLFRHFLRGLFDGDGHVSKDRNMIMFISTKEFLEYLCKNYIKSDYKIKKVSKSNTSINVYRMYVQRRKDILNLLSFMYDDSTVFFKRKYEAYEKLKDYKIYNAYSSKPCKVILGNDCIDFDSLKDAAEFLKTSPSNLSKILSETDKFKGYTVIKGKSIKCKKEIK